MADSIATLVLRIVAHNATAAGFAGVRSEMRGLETAAGIGAVAVGAIGVAAIKTAADYQRSLTQVANNTTMGTAGMQAMDAAIRSIAAHSPASMDELAQGYMRITNLGFGAADATKILEAAQKSAVSTGGDVGDTTNVLANVLHEYAMSGKDAAGVMDVLHLAAAQGNMTLSQLVESGGKAIAMAANMGVPLTQVATALATLTLHGQTAAQASTLVAGLLSKLVNPAKSARTELALLSETTGIDLLGDFSATGLKAKGLTGVLADVRAAHLDATQLAKIMPFRVGGLGLQILTGTGSQDLARLQGSLDATLAGKSTPTADAYARSQKTLAFQLGVVRNDLKLLAITTTPLLGALTALAQVVSGRLQAALNAVQHPTSGMRGALAAAGVVARSFAGTMGLLGQAALALAAAIVGTLAPLGRHNQTTAQGTTHLRQMGAGLALLIPALIAWRGAVTLAHVAQAAWSVAMGAWRVATLAAHGAVLLFRGAILAWHGVTLLARGLTVAWTAAQWLWRAATIAGTVALAVARGVVLAYTVAMGLLRAAVLAGTIAGAGFLAQQILINTWNVTVRGATLLWTAAQWLLNAALTANPIGIVVVAIGALVAALILAWTHSKTLRDLLTGFWAWLSGVFAGGLRTVGEGIKTFLGGAFTFVADKITWFMDKMRGLLTLASHLPKIGDFAKDALAALDALEGRPATHGRLIGPPVPAWLRARQGADLTAMERGGTTAVTTTAQHVVQHVVHHGLTAASHAAAEAVLHPPARPRTPEQAAVLDFHTAMTRFAGQKGLDPNDVARMAADLAKIAAADPAKAAQLQAQLENATQRRHEAIAHHGAVVAHHRQALAQRAAHHAQVVAHHAQVVAHHAAVRAAHADAATLLRTIHNEIREHRFARAARDITRFRGLETTALRAAGLDPTRAAREAGVITRGLQDELARAERAGGRAGRPVALQDAVDRFKTDLLQLGTSARDHARLLADVARIRADEVAAHYRGARVALDLAENSKKVADHFKIIAAARQPVAPVPRYGALAGETGYGQTTVSFGGAQASPWQAMVAALREQITHLRAQLAKDDQLITLLEVGNATAGAELGELRSLHGTVRTPPPPQPAHSVNSHLKARGGHALVGRP